MKNCADCPSCGREYAVNDDDRLTRHGPAGADGHRGCPGGGALIPHREQRPGPAHRSYYVPTTGTRGYRPWDPAVQAIANANRSAAAARRDVELAGKLLVAGWLDDRAAAIATARVRHPAFTWRQIGAALGMTKDEAVSVFRRRCEEAGLR